MWEVKQYMFIDPSSHKGFPYETEFSLEERRQRLIRHLLYFVTFVVSFTLMRFSPFVILSLVLFVFNFLMLFCFIPSIESSRKHVVFHEKRNYMKKEELLEWRNRFINTIASDPLKNMRLKKSLSHVLMNFIHNVTLIRKGK